jgi:spore coat protein I
LARHRIRPTQFDKIYLECFPELIKGAQKALVALEATEYSRLNAEVTVQDMVMNNFSRGNLRILSNHAVCLQFNDYYWELPIVDLALLLVKTGRSHRWGLEWFNILIEEYRTHFSISKEEYGIILAVLSFPWHVYRLCNRYFFNQVVWPISKMTEKLERVLDNEPRRVEFISNLKLSAF